MEKPSSSFFAASPSSGLTKPPEATAVTFPTSKWENQGSEDKVTCSDVARVMKPQPELRLIEPNFL
jgi:hypothetical protein